MDPLLRLPARSPPTADSSSLHINDLAENILVLIFDQLPIEDLVQAGDVCVQWQRPQAIACRRRKSLFLMGPRSKYTTLVLYSRYGITCDQHNRMDLEWADLNGSFCRFLSETFPNITHLEFSGHSDENTFFFLTRLFGIETWFPKLTELKVIIGPLSYAHNDEDDNEFMLRIQNHFYSWNDLLEDINFSPQAAQLRHLTLYNANILRDFRNIPLNIAENFTNLTSLEELCFGVQCENITEILGVVQRMKKLRKFVLFDDDAHVPQERSICEDLASIEPAIMQQMDELCLVYSDEQLQNNLACVDLVTDRCAALTDVHLYCAGIALKDLFAKLARLEHLGHLRLSGFPHYYFGKPQDVPQLASVHTLHLNCSRVLNYSQIKLLVEKCLPNLGLIRQDCLSGLYFMDDFLFPEEDPYLDESTRRLVVMSPSKRIKAELERCQSSSRTNTARYRKTSLTDVHLESASLLLLEQLFPLLTRFDQLKHLRMECPADNFAFFGENLCPLPPPSDDVHQHLDTVQTLHLDCSATGELPCCAKFPATSNYWPNLKLLKLDGLKSTPDNLFDLTESEREFLSALSAFKQLRKVLLIKDCTLPLRNEDRGADKCNSTTDANHNVNFYSVQYLLHKGGTGPASMKSEKESVPQLLLMVGQKMIF